MAEQCFYCERVADPQVPALVPYCADCWRDEHPNVKARLERDKAGGKGINEIVGELFASAAWWEVTDEGDVIEHPPGKE